MRLAVLICIFLHLVQVIQAAPTTNTTNTTTTNDSLEAPSFTTRTLWTIVSSSVLTLFACIYSAIHPNIPSPKDSPYRISRRRLGIMIMALIAPELIASWAMRQWISARSITRQFKESGYFSVRREREERAPAEAPEQCENRLLLAVLAQGVLSVLVFLWHFLCALARPVKRSVEAYFSEKYEENAWTQTHSSFLLMGGFMLYVDGEPYLTLLPGQILKLIRNDCIDVPTLTERQIHDRSKGNAISKGLVILQVAWFVTQLITRAIYHLETTQLEVGTLAFAVLNFLTYAAWWNKPLDVQCPHPVHWKSTDSRPADHDVDVPQRNQSSPWGIWSPVLNPISELLSGWSFVPQKLRVPTFFGNVTEDSGAWLVLLSGLLMATIFGGIHCMGWFFAFPTYQEQALWRMSAVAITCTPYLIFLHGCLTAIPCIPNAVRDAMSASYVMLYVAARAILLVLMFTTLRNLPPDAYQVVSWTSYVPHL
ncbi:hypothetical protein CY34DRAFT_798136 [Suillus luteus UH-Slu-Lm8-n1]|uniref:Uncharacterized protein n=1 Tax=Suillus luteus UH-Slu-Lm8-n1 TaxID=930992 RepID=A0A0D0B3G9_9AGAM|nr:hypothetical protein CY34DRAFT_798136 [Suillus luteus UH-Slu-Lm8-n1]